LIKLTKEKILRLRTELPPIKEALAKFNDDLIREFVRDALERAPDGLWLDPCSSSGRYHPPFDQVVPGGIINHLIIVGLYFVEQGIRRYPEFTNDKSEPTPRWLDLARATFMVHDIAKSGIPWEKRTDPNHGSLGAQFLNRLQSFRELDLADRIMILKGVTWHMGRWTPTRKLGCFDAIVLLIREADYYSTRKRVRIAGLELINYSSLPAK